MCVIFFIIIIFYNIFIVYIEFLYTYLIMTKKNMYLKRILKNVIYQKLFYLFQLIQLHLNDLFHKFEF